MTLFKKKSAASETASPQDIRLAELLRHHAIDCVLDIGANIGQTAQRYRDAGYRGRILSFEPLIDNHARLENLAQSDPLWDIAPRMALGAQAGETTIHVAQNHDMSSLLPVNEAMLDALPKARAVETQSVPVFPLDSVFSDYVRPNETVFVKVDTQGFEKDVIEGAGQTMQAGRIAGWQLELSFFPLYQNEPTFDIITTQMIAHGYAPHYAMQGYFSKKLMRQLQMDIIFFRA